MHRRPRGLWQPESSALPPLSSGNVELDLASDENGAPAWYLLHRFVAKQPEKDFYLLNPAASGERVQDEEAKLLRPAACPERAAFFNVVVRPASDRCSEGVV